VGQAWDETGSIDDDPHSQQSPRLDPRCVLGGAFMGAQSFLWFRSAAKDLRLRHRQVGALAWGLGWLLLALLAALGLVLAAAILVDVLNI
jgi:hypothetical protein